MLVNGKWALDENLPELDILQILMDIDMCVCLYSQTHKKDMVVRCFKQCPSKRKDKGRDRIRKENNSKEKNLQAHNTQIYGLLFTKYCFTRK